MHDLVNSGLSWYLDIIPTQRFFSIKSRQSLRATGIISSRNKDTVQLFTPIPISSPEILSGKLRIPVVFH